MELKKNRIINEFSFDLMHEFNFCFYTRALAKLFYT